MIGPRQKTFMYCICSIVSKVNELLQVKIKVICETVAGGWRETQAAVFVAIATIIMSPATIHALIIANKQSVNQSNILIHIKRNYVQY